MVGKMRRVRWVWAGAAAAMWAGAALLTISAPGVVRAAPEPGYTAAELATHQRARASRLGIGPLHRSKQGRMGEDCASCHGERIVLTDNQKRENDECIDCHGNYADMADKSAEKIKNKHLNAHASHLGPEIACTVCHSGHQESKSYCLNCHTNFDMPVPGNLPAKAR